MNTNVDERDVIGMDQNIACLKGKGSEHPLTTSKRDILRDKTVYTLL